MECKLKNVFNDCMKEDLANDIATVTLDLNKIKTEIEEYDPGDAYKMDKFNDHLNQMNSCIVGGISFKPSLVLETMSITSYYEMLKEFQIDLEDLAYDREDYVELLQVKEMLEDNLADLKEAQERILKMEETDDSSGVNQQT